MRLDKIGKNKLIKLLMIVFVAGASIYGYSLTSTELYSHPTSTNSAEVLNRKLSALSYDFFFEIGLGLVSGHEAVYINGYNPAVGAAKETVMPSSANTPYPFLTANTTLTLVSTDVDDDGDPADTGARTVRIEGLQLSAGDWVEVTDTVTMNGTTPVNTNVQFYRINDMRVNTVGATGWNEGIIDLKNGADILARINFSALQGEGVAQTAVYSIRSDSDFNLCRLFGSTVGGNDAHIHAMVRTNLGPWTILRHFTLKDSPFSATWTYGELIPEKSDIEIVAHATGAGAGIDTGLCGYLLPN